MAFMSLDDKVAVLLETPDLSDYVKDVLDQELINSAAIDQVNDLLQNVGFSPFANAVLLQEARHLYHKEKQPSFIPAWDLETTPAQPQGGTRVSIRKVTYVDNHDIDSMSVEDFLEAIKKTDTEIKRLTDMNIDSAVIAKSIDDLKADRNELVSILDTKHGDASSDDS